MKEALRGRFLILYLLVVVVLTGCWDQQEIEERTSIVALALDKSTRDDGLIRLSAQIPIPKKVAGSGTNSGGAGGKEAVKIISSTGFTVSGAANNLQKRLNQELFYGHTRVIAISEDLAKEGIGPILDSLRRVPQIRRLLWPVVVKGEALTLLQSNPKLEQIPILYLTDLLHNNAALEIIPDITLGRFYSDMSDSTVGPVMNIIEAKGDEMVWDGLAVFKLDKMIGQLNPKEVYSFLQIKEEKSGGTVYVPCHPNQPEKMVVLKPKTIVTKKDFKKAGDHLALNITIRIEGDVVETQCGIPLSKQENITNIERAIANDMKNRAEQLIKRLQTEMHQDVLAFATLLRATHPQWWDPKTWESQEFPKLDVNVDYRVHIRRTGMEAM